MPGSIELSYRIPVHNQAMHEYKNRSFGARLRFAVAGIAYGLSTERSLKTQALVFVVLLIALILVRPAPVWWALVFLASSSVLSMELLNTALERLADHLHPETHPEIRIVKDCAAAGVLIAVLGAGAIGCALICEMFFTAR